MAGCAHQERAEHDDDELHLAGVRRRVLGGRRLLARAVTAGNNWLGDLSLAFLNGVGLEREGRGRAAHDSARALHGVPGDVLHHHGGADLRRHRRAHAVLGLSDVHLLWSLVVYAPVAHWVWGGGWLADMGALGLRRRHRRARQRRRGGARRGHRRRQALRTTVARRSCRTTCPSVLLGAGLLWFGWFGFNAGSALAASPIAGLAFVTTMLAPAAHAGRLDAPRHDALGQAHRRRCATAIVVGLVAITPAAGFISPMNAIMLGAIAAVPSYFALIIRAKTSLDDSLDVVAAHGVGGTVGALLTGVFADKAPQRRVRRRARTATPARSASRPRRC